MTTEELEQRVKLLEIQVSWLMKVHDKLPKDSDTSSTKEGVTHETGTKTKTH